MAMNRERFVHYMSGNKELDEEHFKLLTEFGVILQKIKDNDLSFVEDTTKFLEVLFDHSVQEEKCMVGVNYPYYTSHFDDHVKQRREIQELLTINDMPKRNDFLIKIKLEDLENRFLNHIDHYDLQFTSWLKQKYGDISNFNTLHFCNSVTES